MFSEAKPQIATSRVFGYESFNTIQSHIIPIGYDVYHQLVGKNIGKDHVESFYHQLLSLGEDSNKKARPWYQLSAQCLSVCTGKL